MTKKIIMVDASALSASSCMLRFYQTVIDGYTTSLNDNQIEFGTSVHKFRAHFRSTGDYAAGIIKALEHYETTPNRIHFNKKYLTSKFLQEVCLNYAFKYAKDNFQIVNAPIDGKEQPLLELPFCFPLLITDTVEVLASGTIDEIGYFPTDGIYAICDLKTSAVWKIEEYFKHYELATQMIFYKWAIREYAKLKPNSILKKINDNCGIFIDGVFYKGADKPVDFVRSNMFPITEETLDEFEILFKEQVVRLVSHIDTNDRPFREGLINGSCNTVHGLCKFFGSCSAPDIESRMNVLTNSFVQRFYDPLCFQQ